MKICNHQFKLENQSIQIIKSNIIEQTIIRIFGGRDCDCGSIMTECQLSENYKCSKCPETRFMYSNKYLHCNNCGKIERGESLADYQYC